MAWIMDTYSMNVGLLGAGCRDRQAALDRRLARPGRSDGARRHLRHERDAQEPRRADRRDPVAVQGYGKVGAPAVHLLHELGCIIVAVSDVGGGVYNPHGLSPKGLAAQREATGSIAGFEGGDPITNEELLAIDCDVLIPAALEGQLTGDNAEEVKAPVIVEAANGPTTPEADAIFEDKGTLVVPDILANSGGVTVSYFEWVQDIQAFFWTEDEVNERLRSIMERAYVDVLELAEHKKEPMRTAADDARRLPRRGGAQDARTLPVTRTLLALRPEVVSLRS
jgi:glutamate dehydrogenase (NAD(P)+)